MKQIIATLSLMALLGVCAFAQNPPASALQQGFSADNAITTKSDDKKKSKKKSKRKSHKKSHGSHQTH
jgi:hypothetical protein